MRLYCSIVVDPLLTSAAASVVELVNHISVTEEEEATINVYQTTQSMDSMLLEYRTMLLSME